MPLPQRLLITGGAGFIGSHVVKYWVQNYPEITVFNLDKLTYAGNLENLSAIEEAKNYHFIKGDIRDWDLVSQVFKDYAIDGVIHLAAESHVDRSIMDTSDFIKTNVEGTTNLLNAASQIWDLNNREAHCFLHVSTDEVFGSLEQEGYFTENSPYDPRSPYSASKAAADHMVRSYYHTYGLPIKIANASNNYGPNQFPEKLIPLMINNIKHQAPLPVYGEGKNVRDWLFVEDHVRALASIYQSGRVGETYLVGGQNELKNLDLVKMLCQIMDDELNRKPGASENLIRFVPDRAGHDFRYALDTSKIKKVLGWQPTTTFEAGLRKTIQWYLNNETWLERVTSGAYKTYYQKQYGNA